MRNEIFELLEPLFSNTLSLDPAAFAIVNADFLTGLRIESSWMKFQASTVQAITIGDLIKVIDQDPDGTLVIEKALQGEKPFGVCINDVELEVCAFSIFPVKVIGGVSIGQELIVSATPGIAEAAAGQKAAIALEDNPDPAEKLVLSYFKPYV